MIVVVLSFRQHEVATPLHFWSNERGSIMPIFALLLAMLIGFAGLAVDYARQDRLRSRLTQAADAATLAAAREAASQQEANPTESVDVIMTRAKELGVTHFAANTKGLEGVHIRDFDLSLVYDKGAWTASSKFAAFDHALFGATTGHSTININGKSEASLAPGFPVLDIAMCIDSTGSMTSTLDAVKTNAIKFYDNLNTALAAKGIQPFPLVRVRLNYFKDFGDGSGTADPDPLVSSNFFKLPDEAGNFNAFASPQTAYGGWDWPESGLECLNEAMDSPWTKIGDSVSGGSEKVTDVYPLIVIWTDASSHRIAYPNSLVNPSYPDASKMPRTYADLLAKWESSNVIDQSHKQILFFGDPAQPSMEADGGESGWSEVMTWPNFTLGGTVTEANTDPIGFIAEGIAKTAKGLRITN